MSCTFCTSKEPIKHEWLDIYIRRQELSISYSAYSCDSDFDTKIDIVFCPFCGAKLTTKEN